MFLVTWKVIFSCLFSSVSEMWGLASYAYHLILIIHITSYTYTTDMYIHACLMYIYLVISVQYIALFPYLFSQYPSPFSNLICLTMDCRKKKDAVIVTKSSEARNFFLENSPSATFTMLLPKVLTLIRIIYSSLPCRWPCIDSKLMHFIHPLHVTLLARVI